MATNFATHMDAFNISTHELAQKSGISSLTIDAMREGKYIPYADVDRVFLALGALTKQPILDAQKSYLLEKNYSTTVEEAKRSGALDARAKLARPPRY